MVSADSLKRPVPVEDSNFREGETSVPSFRSIVALLTWLSAPLAIKFPLNVETPVTDSVEVKFTAPLALIVDAEIAPVVNDAIVVTPAAVILQLVAVIYQSD